MKKKKRLKLRKKNFMILCLTIIVLIGSVTLLTRMVVKEISHKNKPQKTLSTKEIKLEKLNNIDKKVNYFNYSYLDRYINYKKKNNNLSDKQIVLNVNMNLDYKFYEKTISSKYLNKEYILVNKYYYVGEKYVPENLESLPLSYSRSGMKLTSVAKSALEELINAAKKDNMTILVTSSYRSYEYQVKLYNQYAEENSKEEADTYSARPGYSEHQTGLAVDIHNGKKVYTDFENYSFDLFKFFRLYMSVLFCLSNPYYVYVFSRHEITCSLEDVVKAAKWLLKTGGHFYMVHRPFRLAEIIYTLKQHKLEPKRMRLVHPYVDKEPNMVLIDAAKGGKQRITVEPPLIVYNKDGSYTDEIYQIYGEMKN